MKMFNVTVTNRTMEKQVNKWIIAKYAALAEYGNVTWCLENSAATTHTGQILGLPESFDSKEIAHEWLEKMLKRNPSGFYAVVEIDGKVVDVDDQNL